MKNTSTKRKRHSGFLIAFLALALAFLAVALGTIGTDRSTGNFYELQYQTAADAKEPNVIFKLSAPKDEDGNTLTVRLSQVYLNVGTIYSDNAAVTLRMNRASTATSTSFSSSKSVTIADPSRTELPDGAVAGGDFNWIAPFDTTSWSGTNLTTYPYYKLAVYASSSSSKIANVLISEVVFEGEVYEDGEGTGEYVLIPAEISPNSELPYDESKGETQEDAYNKACALVDSQYIPTLSQSSFFRYGKEEAEMLSTVAEVRIGATYVSGDVYYGNTAYNSLGLDLLALSTLIFGVSPFSMRFFSVLASFGVLIVGFFLVKRLAKSEKAALVFAVLYALCGLSMSFAHLGTPLMIGVFFLVSALSCCHKFYAEGMKKASSSAAVPLVGAGILSALAVLVNGAFLIPVIGVAGLFAAGMVRQQKARRHYLDLAIAEAEAEEETAAEVPEEERTVSEGRKKVAAVLSEYRYKNAVAALSFAGAFLAGLFVLSLVLMLPASYAYVKLFHDPSAQIGILLLGWKAFAGGFTAGASGAFSPFLRTFIGTGEQYAVTAAVVNPVALIAALFGIVFAVYRIISLIAGKNFGRETRVQLRTLAVPLAGVVLSLITASFAGAAFVFAAYCFAFVLAAVGLKTLGESGDKGRLAVKIILIAGLALLILCFLLFGVFTFSIPLPQSFIAQFAA